MQMENSLNNSMTCDQCSVLSFFLGMYITLYIRFPSGIEDPCPSHTSRKLRKYSSKALRL